MANHRASAPVFDGPLAVVPLCRPAAIGLGARDKGRKPERSRRAFNLGSARPALISLLSPAMMSLGVFLRAPIPSHAVPPRQSAAPQGLAGPPFYRERGR